MQIEDSKVNPPKDEIATELEALRELTKNRIDALRDDLKENRLDYTTFSEKLTDVFSEALTRFENIDKTVNIDTEPLANTVADIKKELLELKKSIDKGSTVNVDNKMDLSELNKLISKIPNQLQAMVQGVDIMEADEFRKNFKDIIRLLEKVAAAEWVSQGSTVITSGGGIAQSDLNTSNLAKEAKQDDIITQLQNLAPTIEANNSTVEILTSGSAFTGASDDVTDYATAFVTIAASHDSASSGLKFQQSSDGTNWDVIDQYSYVATDGRIYAVPLGSKYFRVVYTNGSTNQTFFRLQTKYTRGTLQSSHRIGDAITPENDAQLAKSVLTGRDFVSGNFVNVDSLNASGILNALSVYPVDIVGNSLSVYQIWLIPPNTATTSTVNDTLTSTTIIAANNNRKELEIVNTSSAVLYLLKGTGTASATNFTARLAQNDYYKTDYRGAFRGVWATDPNDGIAMITEST